MKKSFIAGFTMILLSWQAQAASDEQLSSIKQLGQLNGVALHCKALEETQRMKRAMVLNLPKLQQLGELFDHETNDSFLKFISARSTCPSPADLTSQVDGAIKQLQQVFTVQ